MPKIKTHKATSKRFRLTGSGKLKRTIQGKSHFRRNKPQRKINALSQMVIVSGNAQTKNILSIAPYLDKQK